MKRIIAIAALCTVYSLACTLSLFFRLIWKLVPVTGHRHRIIINGTFHNPNWFHAHIRPLVASGYGETILICDQPVAELDNLTYYCPPLWANRLFTRAGAKAIWTLMVSLRRPGDVYIGYHIFPSAITALICGRLVGARVVYQVTSGPLELEGGGWNAENQLLVGLGRPSALVEKLALAVTRQFDVAVVRGSRAEHYLRRHGFNAQLEIVTGSVETSQMIPTEKSIDVIFVGRLAEYKRPDRLIEVIARISKVYPDCTAILVGDGPDRANLESQVEKLGIEDNIEFLGQRPDVLDLLARARVFVLTSRWEGVSIAMLEAMAMKAVPVVSDVGDLSDFVTNEVTGYLLDPDDIDGYAKRILALLEDEIHRENLASAARNRVCDRSDREVLALRWGRILNSITNDGQQ